MAEEDVKPLAKLWFDGWTLGHADYAPPELTKLRTLASFEQRIRESITNCLTSGPIGSPEAFLRIIGDDLDQFYVDPATTGQGLGRRLMAAAEAIFQARNIARPHLFCAKGNDQASGFYTAMGWENCGVAREAFETSEGPFEIEVIRFEKSLQKTPNKASL